MPHSEPLHYRIAHEEPAAPPAADEPREDFGRLSVPVLGDTQLVLGLGRPLRLELDRRILDLELGGGLVVRAPELPEVRLHALHVDLEYGVVQSEAEGLGPCFDRLLTVGLCSALRHTIGWEPGESLIERGAGRLPLAGAGAPRRLWAGRGFPWLRASLDPGAALELELRGDALELALTRPLLLQVLGLGLPVLTLRWVFAEARLEVFPRTVGPLRQLVLRVVAWSLTRRLRRHLPAAMAEPGYDLFADPDRRARLAELWRRLSAEDRAERTGPDGQAARDAGSDMTRGTGPDGRGATRAPAADDTSQETGAEAQGARDTRSARAHDLAREGAGGAASLFSATKAALFGALATLRVSADDLPGATRALVRIPLGPFSALALATDRGGDVVLTKVPGGARLAAPAGIYLYADQFPELSEIRVTRAVVELERPDAIGLDVQTNPPLGSFLRALLRRLSRRHLVPRLPVERLRSGGLFAADGEHHVLWRQDFGRDRALIVRTVAGAEVELRHQEDALVLLAPAGLSILFQGFSSLPAARLRRIAYRWEDGAIEADGDPVLGPFGQTLLSRIVRVRLASRAPAGLGLRAEGGPDQEADFAARYPAEIFSVPLPLIGPLQLRMDPDDTLSARLGPAEMAVESERGLILAAPELGASLEIRDVRYSLPERALTAASEPPPGDYVVALAALSAEALLVPLLRRAVPLWPDARPEETWSLGRFLPGAIAERLGFSVNLSLPPGGTLALRRDPDALVAGTSAPLRVEPAGDALLGEFAATELRWLPAGERLELGTVPPAGPLLHELARRLFEQLAPKVVLHALRSRLALPEPTPPPPPPPAPSAPPLFAPELPLLGPLCLVAGSDRVFDLELRRDRADLRAREAVVLRLPDMGIHLAVRGAEIVFLPFTVELDAVPAAGELEQALVGHALRTLFARVMPLFWPADRAPRGEHDVLLSLGRERPWGPIELCVARGGSLALHLDPGELALRSPEGLFFAGEALAWLPAFTLHELSYRLGDGVVRVRVDGVQQRHYRERDPVSPHTEALLARLIRVLVLPHTPAWMQRLGLRILPPPPEPPPDPTRITVLQAQLPGGRARIRAAIDPADVLELHADRHELLLNSTRGLQIDAPGLHLRIEVRHARYHMASGELQIGTFGQLENALAEAVLRRVVAAFEPRAADPNLSALAALFDRFPVDEEGRRVLFHSKLVDVLLRRETALVVRLEESGLFVTADPPIELDGPAVMNYRFAGLRYAFDEAAFRLDIERDGIVAGMFRGLVVEEAENQLNSLLRPVLPAAMRTPGYRLVRDPDPRATISALLRTVVGGGLLLGPRASS